jgi:hypothetical protein
VLFRKASGVAGVGAMEPKPTDRSLNRTASMIHRELAGFTPLSTNVQVPATNATAKDGDYSSESRTRLEEPPPGIRTASMADLGLGAIGGRSGDSRHGRTVSQIHWELDGTMPPPPPPDSDSDNDNDTVANDHRRVYQYGASLDTGFGQGMASGSPPRATAATMTRQGRRHNARGERGFSIVGEILDGAATARDVAPPPKMIPSPRRTTNAVKTMLDRSPSRRTMQSRTYSSSLESVEESATKKSSSSSSSSSSSTESYGGARNYNNGNSSNNNNAETEKTQLINAASQLYDSNQLTNSEYLKMTDAIIGGDQARINALKQLLNVRDH